MNISAASALPEPNTTCVRVRCSGQRTQPRASSYTVLSCSRRSVGLVTGILARGPWPEGVFLSMRPLPHGTDLAVCPFFLAFRPVSHEGTGTVLPTTATGPTALAGSRLAIVGRGRLAIGARPTRSRETLPSGCPTAGPRARLSRLRRRAALRARRGDRRGGGRASRPGALVGHCSGATAARRARRPHEAFSLHPLMTVPAGSGGDAPAGRRRGDRRHHPASARDYAGALAAAAGMRPFALADA